LRKKFPLCQRQLLLLCELFSSSPTSGSESPALEVPSPLVQVPQPTESYVFRNGVDDVGVGTENSSVFVGAERPSPIRAVASTRTTRASVTSATSAKVGKFKDASTSTTDENLMSMILPSDLGFLIGDVQPITVDDFETMQEVCGKKLPKLSVAQIGYK